MSDPEPVEAPPKAVRPFNPMHVAIGACLTLVLFGGGIAVGIWFATHYRIVPVGGEHVTAPQAELSTPATLAPTPVRASLPAKNSGPFTYKFTPGENLSYRMQAAISGGGLDLGSPSGVDMTMDSMLRLHTDSVAPDGTGDLTLTFNDTRLGGDFMGSDYSMSTNRSGSKIQSGGHNILDTPNGKGSAQGVPQLEFLNTPIHMKVARNGDVQHLSGPQNIQDIISPMPGLTELEFPGSTLEEGAQWTSDFFLPVPGFGEAAHGRMINTFKGYVNYAGRKCGVIEQQITSAQQNGTLNSPKSSLGDAMNFSMPQFDLAGTSMVYFDVDNGKLVRNDLNLDVKLDIGKALGSAGQLVQGLLSQLGDLGGKDLPEFEDLGKKAKENPQDLLKLDLKVDASVSLVDQPPKPDTPR